MPAKMCDWVWRIEGKMLSEKKRPKRKKKSERANDQESKGERKEGKKRENMNKYVPLM